MMQITPTIYYTVHCSNAHKFSKFHEDPPTDFQVVHPTGKLTGAITLTSSRMQGRLFGRTGSHTFMGPYITKSNFSGSSG